MGNDRNPMHAETRQLDGLSVGPRKAWATPRVIVSELRSDTMGPVSKSTPTIADQKIGGTTTIGS
jgi:hypothetical protein